MENIDTLSKEEQEARAFEERISNEIKLYFSVLRPDFDYSYQKSPGGRLYPRDTKPQDCANIDELSEEEYIRLFNGVELEAFSEDFADRERRHGRFVAMDGKTPSIEAMERFIEWENEQAKRAKKP